MISAIPESSIDTWRVAAVYERGDLPTHGVEDADFHAECVARGNPVRDLGHGIEGIRDVWRQKDGGRRVVLPSAAPDVTIV